MSAVVAQVLVEGTIDKVFDYTVPDALAGDVGAGTMVRVELGGRRVGGWVVGLGPHRERRAELKPIAKVTGWGPDAGVIDLARWAAHRWAGRVSSLLRTASPPRAVRALPSPPPSRLRSERSDPLAVEALAGGPRVLQLPPAADRYGAALEAARRGNTLMVTASVGEAVRLARRLRRDGLTVAHVPDDWALARAGAHVVGARAAAWAPVVEPAAFLLFDEHDEVHQEERVPTWHAREVLAERARRTGAPCVLVSPAPSLEARRLGPVVRPPTSRQREGWPVVDVVDRREEDPRRGGLYSPRLVSVLREDQRVVCVLNRTGRARLLACDRCGEVARCERCEAAVVQPEVRYECLRCRTVRPAVCQRCGATANRTIRVGVGRAREELEALVREQVAEVTASTSEPPGTRVVVGTEAVLHHVRDARAVAFLDFDQELLAPRYRAAEQALGLIVRAARLLGPRSGGGRLLVQTRQPDSEVVRAASVGDPDLVAEAERGRRELLGFPPVTAMAEVSGSGAGPFVTALGRPPGVQVQEGAGGRWLIRAPDHDALAEVLAATPRPRERVRIAVDPLRL